MIKAGKIEAGFEALRIYDYFKAKKLFYSQINKSSKSQAAYGLAVIYYRGDNPFHNLDSATKYITLSGNSYDKKVTKKTLSGYTIDSLNIRIMADSIGAKSILKSYKINTIDGYEDFLNKHRFTSLKLRNDAYYLRDELCYKANLLNKLSDSTRQYILRFPESYFLNDYIILLDKQIFEEQTTQKNAAQYIAFIRNFPKNRNIRTAEDELFNIYRNSNDIGGLDFFVKNYKNSNSLTEAWKLLYALSVKSYNTDELQNFANKYPDFPFKNSINKEIELNSRVLIAVTENDNTGFADTTGKFVIAPVYEAATPFKEGLAVVVRNDSSAFINKENTNAFNSYYSEAFAFTNGKAPVSIDGQWFLINHQGQKVLGPYEEIWEQSENAYIIKQDKKYGAIDVFGNIIIQPQFDKMGDFKNGTAYYMNNNQYGFVSRTGVVSKAQYQWISDFDENKTAIVKNNNLYGLINQNDGPVLAAQYDLIVKAKGTYFILVKNNKYGFYNTAGCFITEIDYDYKKEVSADHYTNGKLFKLIKNKQQALMDENGRITIDFDKFEEVSFIQNGLIKVKRKKKYGFADRKLNMVIPCKYNSATDFEDSLSICTLKQETYLINTKGEEVFKTKGTISTLAKTFFWVSEEEGNKLLDKKGRLLISGIDSYQISLDIQGEKVVNYLILQLQNNSRKVLKF